MKKNINIAEILALDDLPNEEWRCIQGYDYYMVNNLGRVKSMLSVRGVSKI